MAELFCMIPMLRLDLSSYQRLYPYDIGFLYHLRLLSLLKSSRRKEVKSVGEGASFHADIKQTS